MDNIVLNIHLEQTDEEKLAIIFLELSRIFDNGNINPYVAHNYFSFLKNIQMLNIKKQNIGKKSHELKLTLGNIDLGKVNSIIEERIKKD